MATFAPAMRAQIAILGLLLCTSGCLRRGFDDAEGEVPPPAPPPDRAAALEAQLAEVQRELAAREAGLQDASIGHAELSRRIEELTLLNNEMTERLRASAQSTEQLSVERVRLATALVEAMARLQKLEGDAPPGEAAPAPSATTANPPAAEPVPPPLPPPAAGEVAAAPEQ